jgi:Flp pilus assembly pilin Flp
MVSKILTWFKDNLLVALIALVIVIVLQKCERDAITLPEIIVKTDTIWKKVTDTIVTKPKLIKTIVGKTC